ncbi:DNRLRE domain-containing protein [Sporolactobacillus shoreicorticis]|uniref:DNRLRE domain-containing protein n=1 Tax=Sporolactobacillus shoreicorticis TaxID=1923877 RepID=A0ABW5S2P0_9BACL|nr:DNRLRE domain-containing protein [Sporolactobacillus shoreicorticis]MCO7125914.1 DNRLRE domain-containing protein [Sporolactobacillus shoreicorticis]
MFFTQLKKWLCTLLCAALIISLLPSVASADSAGSQKEKVDQSASASSNQTKKELVSERDAYSKTFVDSKGQRTKEIYATPIHHKKSGKWEKISNDLVQSADRNELQTDSTSLKAVFPKVFNENKAITYRYGKYSLSFSQLKASDGEHTYTANKSVRTKNENNQIIYQNIFSSIDLRHITLDNEVKEDWIINQYSGINQFQYKVTTDSVAQIEKDGSIGFYKDEKKEDKVFELPRPVMEDSAIDPGLGSGARSDDVHYTLEKADQGYLIHVIASKDWLESKDRVYPVYIDPSVSIDILGDTFISSAYPTTNYNKEWDSVQGEYVLKVGKYDSTTGTNYAYMKFEVVGDLKGAIIDSASLNTYVTHSYYATQKTGIWVDRVTTGPWYVNDLIWNNRPKSTSLSSTSVARDQWASFNVKSAVQGWVNGDYPNYGFRIHENGNGQTYWKKLTAAESANKAKLVISYHYPMMKNPSVTAAQDGAGTGYTKVSWPSVSGASSYSLQMFDGKGFETVYTGSATSWSSQGKKLFPKTPYSSSSTYKLDGSGTELALNPSAFYSAKSGTSTTRKEYGFRVVANYPSGGSPVSSEVKATIPATTVETPDLPTVQASAYPDSDTSNTDRGWLDLSWKPVPNATSYKVLVYNGKSSEEFDVGKVTSWSTKGKKIWPTASEISSGRYTLHHDQQGAELPIEPNPVYQNAAKDGGSYTSYHRYSIRIKAVNGSTSSSASDSQYGYIPLDKPTNVTMQGNLTDPVTNKGALSVQWSQVTGAGGYKVEIWDGKDFHSYDAGKTTNWNSDGISLFTNVTDLPMDPSKQYALIGAPQWLIDKKAYQVHVRAYRYNEDTAPSSETEKMTGERGLSAATANQYCSITKHEELWGLEDYFTYDKHELGNATASFNVTAGNFALQADDQSLFTISPLEFTFTRIYNSRSNKTSALGYGWIFSGNERLTKKDTSDTPTIYYDDEDGTRHAFFYDVEHHTYLSPKGKYLTLTQESVGGAAGYRLKDSDGFSKLFEQDPTQATQFRLSAYQDAHQNEIRFTYNASNQLTQITEVDHSGTPVRYPIDLTYNDQGKISKAAFKDRSVDYHYDGDQLVQSTTHASGTSRTLVNSYDYDEEGRLTQFTDSKGNEDTISYGEHELSILEPQKSGAESVSTTYHYDDGNNSYEVSDTTGRTTTYQRDVDHDTYAVAHTENADGTTSKVNYDDNYNTLNETDENGKTATHTYDSRGNTLSDTDKDGKTTTYRYDDQNHVIEKTDPDGTKTTNQYTGDNLTQTQIGEEITKYAYDEYGRQTKVTYPNQTYSTTDFQDGSLKEIETDAKGNTTTTAYNDYGQTIRETDADGRTTQYTYDPLNADLKTSVTDGNGNKTSYTYDDNGNMTSLTNAKGKTKTYTYNGNNQLLTTELPINGTTVMKTSNAYDANGNLAKETLNSGITTQYDYDEVNQVTKATVQKAGQNVLGWSNTYDDAGNLTGRTYTNLTTNTPLVTKKWAYTPEGLLTNYIQGSFQTTNSYDANSQLTKQNVSMTESTQPLNVDQSFAYTPEGKVDNVKVAESDGDDLLQLAYTYDLTHNKTAINLNNGLFTNSYVFDEANHLTGLSYTKDSDNSPALNVAYSYDHSGNITKASDSDGDSTYTYDGNSQLTKEVLPDGTTNTYTYDSVGNRTASLVNGAAATFTYNDANQILTKNGTAFRYDADGNLTQDDQFNYEYDAMGNQTKVSKLDGTEVARYEYDENGLRTKKIMGDQTNEYYYDSDSNHLILRLSKKGNELQSYHYYQWDPNGHVVGMVVKDKDSSGNWKTTPYYFLTNQRGDVVQIVNKSGDQVGSYTYDAYGNILSEDGAIAKDNEVRYASYTYDSETQHYYLQARYYDPQNGNFLSMDPDPGDDGNTLSQNGYTYAENNPMTHVDPDGNFAWALIYFIPVIGEYAAAATLIGLGAYAVGYGVWHLTRAAKHYYLNARKVRSEKKTAIRSHSISKKKAKWKAKRAGDNKEPRHDPWGKHGPHYHPNVPKKDPRYHDHYYYPKSRR